MNKRGIINSALTAGSVYLGRRLFRQFSNDSVKASRTVLSRLFLQRVSISSSIMGKIVKDGACRKIGPTWWKDHSLVPLGRSGFASTATLSGLFLIDGIPCYSTVGIRDNLETYLYFPRFCKPKMESLFTGMFAWSRLCCFPTTIRRPCVDDRGCRWEYAKNTKSYVLDNIPLHTEVRAKIRGHLDRINREWDKEESIGYSRNLLFYGPKGTGKSHLTIAIANELKAVTNIFPIVRDSSVFTELVAELNNSCSVIVADEVESVPIFCPGYQPSSPERLSTRNILDYFSGMGAPAGTVTLVCTNDPNKIDERLRRKGRFKEEIHVGDVDSDGIKYWLEKNYSYIVPDAVRLRPTSCADIFDLMDTLDDPEAFVKHIRIPPRVRKKRTNTDVK